MRAMMAAGFCAFPVLWVWMVTCNPPEVSAAPKGLHARARAGARETSESRNQTSGTGGWETVQASIGSEMGRWAHSAAQPQSRAPMVPGGLPAIAAQARQMYVYPKK